MKDKSDHVVVITPSEDGAYIEQISDTELEKRLNEEYYGGNPKFLQECPKEHDTNYWGEDVVIILRANFVVPQAITTVTKWEVD